MLHILNKPPHSEAAQQMLSTAVEGDTILLIEDAVQAVLHPEWSCWNAEDVQVLVLEEDAASRGLLPGALIAKASWVTMDGFVELTEQNANIISWY
ncbi:sulfurtransferase complex subunit TusB [Vreelandella aquamarina]|uniref:sulfurtransferase complex subunit TusB n=1 Tax=Vreelandella aquamarina TaxID=77097 RepID=UPI003850EC88